MFQMLLTGCVLLASPYALAADAVTGTLYWGNGDSLNGHLVSAKDQTLIWKSPLFADPLSVDLSVLSAVRFPELESSEPAVADSDFRITLENNNVLFGKLAGVDDRTLTFHSERHGTVVLNKSAIRNLQKAQSQGMLFLGPRGLDGWSTGKLHDSVPDWRAEDDGSLTTVTGESSLLHQFAFPERCEVEVVLTSSTRIPDFVLAFGERSSEVPRVEMWGDSFVALSNSQNFADLQTVSHETRKMHFRLFIDFQKSYLAVYSNAGKKLGDVQGTGWNSLRQGAAADSEPPPAGFRSPPPEANAAQPQLVGSPHLKIAAVDSDLSLKLLRISEWDGSIPQALVPGTGQSRIQLQSGTIHYGQIEGFSADQQSLQLTVHPSAPDATDAPTAEDADRKSDRSGKPGSSKVIDVAVADIRQWVLSTDETRSQDDGRTIVAWRNGGFVSGKLLAMDHESITLKTDFSDQPVKSSLAGVRRIGLPNTDRPSEEPDRLFFEGGSLRGNLTVEDNAEPIRWTPVGGRNATTLVSGGQARFQRGTEPEDIAIDATQFPDVVYLHDGDVFPCRLESADGEQLRIVSPVSETRQLDASLVKAMEFGNSQRARQQGFDDNGWKRLRGTVNSHNGQAISFTSTASYGHENILTGDAVSCTVKWKPSCYGNLVFHLFADSLTSPRSATVVNLNLQPNQVVVSDRAPEQNARGFFGFNRGGVQPGMVRVKNQTVQLEMVARDGKLIVRINGEEAKQIELNSLGAASQRLLIQANITSVNGRNSRSLNTTVRDMLEIDEFLVRNEVGASVKQFVREEARERALMVPRFRRDDPFTHVLLAPNGDLLRGRMTAITASDVVFESRLESFRFPRDRVAAVIWLSPVDKDAAGTDRADTAVQARLDNGYMLTMTPERMSDGQLVGHSQQLGTCRIPAKAIRDLFLGRQDGQDGILSYVRWIRTDALEPQWESPNAGDDGSEHETVGRIIDDFELPTLDGGLFKLSDHADQVVVLDFWATWCGPCVAALPEYVAATSDFNESDAIFVAVNLEEAPDRIREFLDRHELSPSVALDRGSVIARRFGVSGIPHSVVLGPGGVVKHVTVGYQKGVGEKTRLRIQQLLDEERP